MKERRAGEREGVNLIFKECLLFPLSETLSQVSPRCPASLLYVFALSLLHGTTIEVTVP